MVSKAYYTKSKLLPLADALKKGDNSGAQSALDDILKEIKLNSNNNSNETDRMLKIYVAGPYTAYGASQHDAPRIMHNNTVKAIDYGLDAVERGHLMYIPHLSHFVHLHGKKTLSYKYYTESDIGWLKACDAIFYYNHKIGASKGADNELEIAIRDGKDVFFFPDEIPLYKEGAEKFKE